MKRASSHDPIADALQVAEAGIAGYLDSALAAGKIDPQSYQAARDQAFGNLQQWLTNDYLDEILPNLKKGILATIRAKRWKDLVNAFRQWVRFGTGGIRGMMAFDKPSILRLKREGIHAPILKGPNTFNDLVLLRTSVGVARFGKDKGRKFRRVVIGYDSRIRGQDFAALVARLFLAYGYEVCLFDEPCPYPEVTFAIPSVQADIGILISASHNDYRYNGYKLSCANGSQFDPEERRAMYDQYIRTARFEQIRLTDFDDAPASKLVLLGGARPVGSYARYARKHRLIDMHRRHQDHMRGFLLTDDLAARQRAAGDPLNIAFCAFHGAGRVVVPNLLKAVGFRGIRKIQRLHGLDGMFPCFRSDPGHEQQPDPGDPRAAEIAVREFKKQYPRRFKDVDILIGTDPDADRCGVVVKVAPDQRDLYGGKDHVLLPADDAWALVLWYRFLKETEKHGRVLDAEKRFIVLSHTTADTTVRLCRKVGIGVVKTWVGFANLAAATRDVWDGKARQFLALEDGRDGKKYTDLCHPVVCTCEGMAPGRRSINIAAMEQSNGFSILGGPPPDGRSMGAGGHVRDKDGTFAAMLVAEVAAYAKEQGTTLLGLLDQHICLDPDVGLFVNLYEPDPLDGEYPGIEGDRRKKGILRRALGYFQLARSGDLAIGGARVTDAVIYRTGKYDVLYPPTYDFEFPDEGVRFFFDDERLDHLTVRPSGTGNSLRFHVQLHATPTARNLLARKRRLRAKGKRIMDGIRKLLKAPRS